MGRDEKVSFFHLPLATKLWIYFHPPSPFKKKVNLDHWVLFLSLDVIFNSNLENIVLKVFLKRERKISFGRC
jgi:hypothetical protein